MFGFSKSPKSRKLGTRRLAYEQLERREMLSGGGRDGTVYPDWEAYVDDGTLYIIGSDNDGDDVTVRDGAYPCGVTVYFSGWGEINFCDVQVDKIRFFGGGGNDTFINFTALPSVAYGGLGNDELYGGSGSDKLFGEAGDDILCGDYPNWLALGGHQGADDWLYGGADNDTYLFDLDYYLGHDYVDEGGNTSWFDTLDFSSTTHTQVDLDLGENNNGHCNSNENLQLTFGLAWDPNLHFLTSGIENVIGGAADDIITGNALDNILVGGPGCDHLDGAAGNDWLLGAAGDDWLYAGPGDDVMIGGGDNDTYVFDMDVDLGSEELWERPQDGERDTLDFSPTTGYGVEIDLGYPCWQCPQISAGGTSFRLLLVNPLQPPPGYPPDPNYCLFWDSFEDVIGTPNDDRISGNKLCNILCGGDGDDQLFGFGWGNQTAYPQYPDQDWLDGGPGNDTLKGGVGNDWLYGGRDRDTLEGNEGDDWLYGDDGSDVLEGGEGEDWLWGGPGVDIFKGGPGADHIRAVDMIFADSIWIDAQDDVEKDSIDGYIYTAVIPVYPIRSRRSRRAGDVLGPQAAIPADYHLPLHASFVSLPCQSPAELPREGLLTRSTDRCTGDLLHSTRAGCISR